MGIFELIGALNNASELNRVGSKIAEQFQPVNEAMDSARMGMADFFGDTKSVSDEGYDSGYKVIDQEAFNKRMDNIANASSNMSKMDEIKSGVLPPQVTSSPAPMGVQAPNPYASVNYGTMPFEGGIGRAPSMEEILKALQSRGQ